jgi:hypothetical protein
MGPEAGYFICTECDRVICDLPTAELSQVMCAEALIVDHIRSGCSASHIQAVSETHCISLTLFKGFITLDLTELPS